MKSRPLNVSEKHRGDLRQMIGERVATYGRMIRFSHSIFALPFAYAAVAMASLNHAVSLWDILWILGAMVSARSAAMGFNRLVDAGMDARNPRTANRELPRGAISVAATTVLVIISSALFILFASRLGPLALKLAPLALAYICLYSFTKRFTWACHLFLGVGIGIAPMGAWIGVTGGVSPVAVLLWIIVTLWVAGFDIVYACLDYEHDLEKGIHSIPAKVGIRKGLLTAKLFHVAALLLMVVVFLISSMHFVYLVGLVVIAGVFIYQHSLVKPDDLSQVVRASLDLNGIVSTCYFGVTLTAVILIKMGVGIG